MKTITAKKWAIAERLTAWEEEGTDAIEDAVQIILKGEGDQTLINRALWIEEKIDVNRNAFAEFVNNNGNLKHGIIKNLVDPFIADVCRVGIENLKK